MWEGPDAAEDPKMPEAGFRRVLRCQRQSAAGSGGREGRQDTKSRVRRVWSGSGRQRRCAVVLKSGLFQAGTGKLI